MNFIKKLILFRTYKKNLKKNQDYLQSKYGLELNIWYDVFSTINFADAPEELKNKLDFSYKELELKKYIALVKDDFDKLDLSELISLKEIIKLDTDNYGLSFGFSLSKTNKKYIINKFIVYSLSLIGIVSAILTFLIFK